MAAPIYVTVSHGVAGIRPSVSPVFSFCHARVFPEVVILMLVVLLDIDRGISPRPPDEDRHLVVLYDGVCGLCNRFVQWVTARDVEGVFRFAPLQDPTAASLGAAPSSDDARQWTIVLTDESGLRYRSDVVLAIVTCLGGLYGVARMFLLIPRPLRDAAYRMVTHYRYRILASERLVTFRYRTNGHTVLTVH